MEEEYIQNQARLKPQEEKNEEERTKVDEIRGTPMAVGSLEEIIDDNHAIVSSAVGPECYSTIMSFVDKDAIEPGCQVLLSNKVCWGTANTHHMQNGKCEHGRPYHRPPILFVSLRSVCAYLLDISAFEQLWLALMIADADVCVRQCQWWDYCRTVPTRW